MIVQYQIIVSMSELFHRFDIIQGLVFGAQTQCGIPLETGEICKSCPVWKVNGRFVCTQHKPPEEINLFCSICLEECNMDESFQTKCRHVFHTKCINKWKSTNNKTCPVCRSRIISYFTPTRVKMTPLQKIQTTNDLLKRDDLPLHIRRILLKKRSNYEYAAMTKLLPIDLVEVVNTIHIAYEKTLTRFPYTIEIFKEFKTWYPVPKDFKSIEDIVEFYK